MTSGPSKAQMQRQAITAKRREAIATYLTSEDWESKHVELVLQLVDLYKLMHPVSPNRPITARDILRQADAAALKQRKKTWLALKHLPLNERKLQSDAAAEFARERVRSQQYQRVRGSAVIPRYPNPEDRSGASLGRRPELEVTCFIQVGARYLNENCDQALDHSEECLAGVLLRAEGKLHPTKSQTRKMKDRLHTRFMEAPELDDFDYYIAIGQDPGEEWLPTTHYCRVPTDGTRQDVFDSGRDAKGNGG